MRKSIILFLVFFFSSLSFLNAQEISLEKEIVLEKIDKHSELAFIYQDGVLLEKGILKKGKRDGVWQSFNPNGNLAVEASFNNGLKDGVWVIYDGGVVKYLLHYQNNLRMKSEDLALQ